MHPLGPGPPPRGKRRHVGRPLGGEVVLLGAVGGEIVEFPRPVATGADELQVADADGRVALVLPEDRVAVDGLAAKCRHEASALGWLDAASAPLFWIGRGRHVEAGWHDVDHMRRIGPPGTAAGDARGPVRYQRRSDAAFVHESLRLAKGHVLQKGPTLAAKPGRAGLRRVADASASGTALGIAAVVAQKQDQRVVEQVAVAEALHEIPDRAIHEVHGRRVDRHEVIEAILLVRGERIPGGHRCGPRRGNPAGIDETERLLPLEPLAGKHVPAPLVSAAKLLDLGSRRLEREMGRVVGQIEKERLARSAGLVDEREAERRPEVGRVPVGGQPRIVGGDRFAIEAEVIPRRARVVKTAGRGIEAPLKAAIGWRDALVLPHMPLAGHAGEIARITEHLGDGDTLVIEPAAIAGQLLVVGHVADPGLMRVETGEQARPRGAAAGGVVALGEPQAVCRQGIEVRRGDLAAVAAQVGEAHVIDQDHDDVRPRRRCRPGGRASRGGGADRRKAHETEDHATRSAGRRTRTPRREHGHDLILVPQFGYCSFQAVQCEASGSLNRAQQGREEQPATELRRRVPSLSTRMEPPIRP